MSDTSCLPTRLPDCLHSPRAARRQWRVFDDAGCVPEGNPVDE